MTELLHKEFSRTTVLKGGGAMVVGISMAGALAAKSGSQAVDPFASMGPYPGTQIDTWLVVNADNTVTLKAGKIELGQGT